MLKILSLQNFARFCMKFEQMFVPLDAQPCEMLIVYPDQLVRDKDGTTYLHSSYQNDKL